MVLEGFFDPCMENVLRVGGLLISLSEIIESVMHGEKYLSHKTLMGGGAKRQSD